MNVKVEGSAILVSAKGNTTLICHSESAFPPASCIHQFLLYRRVCLVEMPKGVAMILGTAMLETLPKYLLVNLVFGRLMVQFQKKFEMRWLPQVGDAHSCLHNAK